MDQVHRPDAPDRRNMLLAGWDEQTEPSEFFGRSVYTPLLK